MDLYMVTHVLEVFPKNCIDRLGAYQIVACFVVLLIWLCFDIFVLFFYGSYMLLMDVSNAWICYYDLKSYAYGLFSNNFHIIILFIFSISFFLVPQTPWFGVCGNQGLGLAGPSCGGGARPVGKCYGE